MENIINLKKDWSDNLLLNFDFAIEYIHKLHNNRDKDKIRKKKINHIHGNEYRGKW